MPLSAPGTWASAASRCGPGCQAFAWRGFSRRCIELDPHGEEARSAVSNHVASGYPSRRAQKRAPQDEGETCDVTFDDVRKFALAWPEVEDGTSYGTPALKVRKTMLARLREDNDSLVMPGVPLDEREMLIESAPKVVYFTDHYRDYPMVLIRLSKAR